MYVSEIKKKEDNRRFFQIEIYSNSRTKKIDVKLDKIIKKIQSKFTLENYIFLPQESSGNLSKSIRKGIYVFEKKHVDIVNKHVKINHVEVKIETKQIQTETSDEPKEALPYGLKKSPIKKATPKANTTNTTRRKRTSRRKTTEE